MTEPAPARAPIWSRGTRIYVRAIVGLGVLGVLISWLALGPPRSPVAFVTLLVLGLLSVVVREPDVGTRVSFSFLSIIVIASIALTGPVGSALIGALSNSFERGYRPLVARLFNAGMAAVQGVVGGVVYLLASGATDFVNLTGPSALLLHIGLPLIGADVAQMLVNAILLAGVVRLSSGVPPRRFFIQIVSNSGIAYMGYGVIGFLLVILWIPADVGPFSAVLILAPLMVARWAFVQFGEEQRAHERALSALVTAMETKDPSATGHSARIAQLAEWMAAPLAMGAQETQALRFSAMLHDVGKVGVPTRVLRGRHHPTRGDLESLTRHPELGVELVSQIKFLDQSLDGMRHHHERWDGRGYPDGLRRDAIPLASRVIAVADAFDALTTPRPGRPALTSTHALAEIEARQGRQFDPLVVGALGAALERHTWTSAGRPDSGLVGYIDHDDPQVWEQVWTSLGADPAVPAVAATQDPPAQSRGPDPDPAPGPPSGHSPASRLPVTYASPP